MIMQCECGEATGVACEWSGPEDDLVTVEYMPEYLRETHRAAGNSGVWPANGSLRLRVTPECAAVLADDEEDDVVAS